MANKFQLVLFFIVSFFSYGKDVSILSFGAKANQNFKNTKSIQAAINKCRDTGGGLVKIPKGKFISGSLEIFSDVFLFLEPGAELTASIDHSDFPSGHFILAKNAVNSGFLGTGTINGNGYAYWDENFNPKKRPEPFILFIECRQLKFRDIKIVNSPSHVLRLDSSQDILIEGLYIENPEQSPNTDGIDIADSKNVFITNCTIITGDDAICLKSKKKKVENISVTNCLISSDDGGLKLGTGSTDTIQYCVFSNIQIRKTRYGIALFMQEGGVYRFISFNNITIENGGRQSMVFPVFMDVDKKTSDGKLGKIEFISFNNLQIETSGNILIAGQIKSPIENLSLSNISILYRRCDMLTYRRKPRGNKSLPVFEDTADYSTQNAHISLANIINLSTDKIQIIDKCENSNRVNYFKKNVL